jgi:hypothetical protein
MPVQRQVQVLDPGARAPVAALKVGRAPGEAVSAVVSEVASGWADYRLPH